jgi:Asp/Glu/hydantoin racemase
MGADRGRVAQTLALIHTSPTLTPIFGALCAEQMPGITLFHMVDESLIRDTIEAGEVRKMTIRRLLGMVESAAAAGADAIMVTCSTLGPAVTLVQQMFDLPVIRVDEAMAEAAVQTGHRLGVMATLRTTLEPTTALLRQKAAQAGRTVELVECLCDGAFEAVLAGDTATHDQIVGAALLDEMSGVDAVVLAQASMARVVDAMPKGVLRMPVLSSPELSVRRAWEILQDLSGAAV